MEFHPSVLRFLESQHYLRPVRRDLELACRACGGVKGGAGYDYCYNCQFTYASVFPLRIGFGIYALSGEQDAYAMVGYKSNLVSGSNQNRNVVGSICYLGIREYITRWGADVVTTVPSLSGRRGEHPLNSLVKTSLSHIPGAPPFESLIRGGERIDEPRKFAPSDFYVENDLRGVNVLLVDDTWASGGHVTSAATALREKGADVAAFVVARWLNKKDPYDGTDLYRQAGEQEFTFGVDSFYL